jgi:radical SAM protein with 4Fe4S-binding SPASM domain
MKPKQILTNKSFCALPWTGFIVQQNGDVKNCVLADKVLGNINNNSISEILQGPENKKIKEQMILDQKPASCRGCYKVEEGKKNFDIISQRLYYLKELKEVDPTLYDQIENFKLHTVDIRWTNQCNQACVYCGPHNSTLWEKEVGKSPLMSNDAKNKLRTLIEENISQLINVYLAGGEPMLMNENIRFLSLLKEKNPTVHLRVNTNLSNIETKVAKLIRSFENVHWIVSMESTHEHYDYIRHGGRYERLIQNLAEIKKISSHKISFNMLHCVLNHLDIFKCIDTLSAMGFHNNSFVIGPVLKPMYLNIRNLPLTKLNRVREELEKRISQAPGFLLEDGYRNMLGHIDSPFDRNFKKTLAQLRTLDDRRGTSSRSVMPELYD